MKLYSRGQLAFASILGGLATGLLLLGVGLPILLSSISGMEGSAGDAAAEIAEWVEPEFGPDPREPLAALDLADRTDYLEGTPAQAQRAMPFSDSERANIEIYERLNAGVVNITTQTMSLGWFLEPVPRAGGSGSGSIIDPRGYVLTNNHVIANAHRVFITLACGTQFDGTVVGTDPENDLAVLSFDPPPGMTLQVIPLGDSAALRVGQKVLAIGNPFALERTLTVGIVSGLGRPILMPMSGHVVRDMIQTDASINPGNSGGPLLDSQGRMIGINTMIYSPTGGSVGIGFAVPVNTARRVVSDIILYGRVRRGWIDASMVQLFPALVRHAGLPVEQGLLVSRTRRNGLAEGAGIRQGSQPVRHGRSVIYVGGDVITAVNGVDIRALSDLYGALEASRPGDMARVTVIRDGNEITLEVPLANREEVLN